MKIDRFSDVPIYMQIYNGIVEQIVDGYLTAGERLTPRRKLSQQLGVAERTVENAYNKLINDEYIVSRGGSGYFVSTERVWDDKHQIMKSCVYNLSTNGVETSKLPFAEWSKLLRSTVREDTGLFQHGEKAGEWCLRKSIRRMLFKDFGVRCKTEQIIIGPGAEDLLCELMLLLAYDSTVIMNNCFNYRVKGVSDSVHMNISYLSDGPDGIDTNELANINKGLLYVKPVHNLPTAVSLSEEKKLEIARWADGGKYVVEDTAENHYQYGKREKTIWELAEGRNVIFLGSFSNTIAPSMKIGYIVVPQEIGERWFAQKRYYSNRVSRVEQVTLSKFIDRGHYERHVNYMRDVYKAKMKAFEDAIKESPLGGICRLSGTDAGMYCLAECDIELDEKEANSILAAHGVKLSPLNSSMYDEEKSGFKKNTYVVGFGEMTITRIRESVAEWAKAWRRYL